MKVHLSYSTTSIAKERFDVSAHIILRPSITPSNIHEQNRGTSKCPDIFVAIDLRDRSKWDTAQSFTEIFCNVNVT